MKADEISKILDNLTKNNNYTKILINGSWGIGKSYYIREYIKNKENVVYISLFGRNTLSSIYRDVSMKLYKQLKGNKKMLTKAKRDILKNFKGINLGGWGFQAGINFDFNQKEFLEDYNKILKEEENLIIIFDDLERKSESVNIIELLGLFEELSLFDKVKIVMISDENKLKEQFDEKEENVWNKFKEKIIEKEYFITDYSDDAIKNILNSKCKDIEETKLDTYIESYIEDINSKGKETKNLRSIIKGINLYNEIINLYLNNKIDETNRLILLKTCLSVTIEINENLFAPLKQEIEVNEKEKNINKEIAFNLRGRDKISIISSKYFVNNEDNYLVPYVYNLYYSKNDCLPDFLKAINGMAKAKNEEDENYLFLLNDNDLYMRVKKLYDEISEGEYSFINAKKLLQDINNLIVFSKIIGFNYNDLNLYDSIANILIENMYDKEKTLYENLLDYQFYSIIDSELEVQQYIEKYNKYVTTKYVDDIIEKSANEIKNKKFDRKNLENLESTYNQLKQDEKENFYLKLKDNKYFFTDLGPSIKYVEYVWNLYVMKTLFRTFKEDSKMEEINVFLEEQKGDNKMKAYRINCIIMYGKK